MLYCVINSQILAVIQINICQKKFYKTVLYIGVLLLITFLIAVASFSSTVVFTGSDTENSVIIEKNARLVEGRNDSGLSLPKRVHCSGNSPVTVVYRLPVNISAGDIFSIETNYCNITAYVDEGTIYSQLTKGKYPLGKIYNNIRLSPEMSGQVLTVVFKPYGSTVHLSEALIGSRPEIDLHRVRSNPMYSAVCCFGVLLGLTFLLIGITFTVKKYQAMSTFVSFGAFSLCLFGWGCTEIPQIMLWNNNRSVLYYLSFVLFMLIPVFLIPLLKDYLGNSEGGIFELLRCMFIGCIVLSLTLHLTGLLPLCYGIYLHYILVGVLICFSTVKFLKLLKTGRRELVLPFFCCLSLFSCAVITMIGYFAWDSFESAYYTVGLLLCLAFMLISAYAFFNHMMQTLSKIEYYRQMSFIDQLTGISNRNSYEARLKNITQYEVVEKSIGFVMIDIDRFKSLNDGYGHIVGDEALSFIGSCIKESFQDIGDCYRIGGDEFTVIVKDAECDTLTQRIKLLQQKISSVSSHLSVSCGCSYLPLNQEIPNVSMLMTIINEADNNMYLRKREHNVTEKSDINLTKL